MIKSMTGFGSHSTETDSFKLTIELKSLNSKTLDANLRYPRQISDKELEIRNLLSKELVRGKISLNIDFQKTGVVEGSSKVNSDLVAGYYKQLEAVADQVGSSKDDLLRLALGMNNAVESVSEGKASDDEWLVIKDTLKKAIINFNEFRDAEGLELKKEFDGYINRIESLLQDVLKQDPVRIENQRKKIRDKIEEVVEAKHIDNNRFEQELIYYIEKLDITEEKVRLQNHLNYFREVIETGENTGKKLGFIGQEIGREINTIGSKANDAVVQQLVVNMKEELEKIKEQVLNIL